MWRDRPVGLVVLGDVRVEQQDRDPPDLGDPDGDDGASGRAARRDGQRLAVAIGARAGRQPGEVVVGVGVLLVAVRVDRLAEVALAVHQPTPMNGRAMSDAVFSVVAGQDAEAAGVDPERLVEAVLGAEVGDRPLERAGVLAVEPVVRPLAMYASKSAMTSWYSTRKSWSSRSWPPVDRALEHGHRVPVAGPGGGVDPVEEALGLRDASSTTGCRRGGAGPRAGVAGGTARRASSARDEGDPCAANDRGAVERGVNRFSVAPTEMGRCEMRVRARRRVRAVGQGRRPGRRGRRARPQPRPDRARSTPRSTSSCPATARCPVPPTRPRGRCCDRRARTDSGPGRRSTSRSSTSRPTATGSGSSTTRRRSTATAYLRLLADDPWRFGLLGRAVLETLRAEGRPIDLLHVHDWHASTTLVLRDRVYADDRDRRPRAAAVAAHDPQPRLPRLGRAGRPGQLGLAPGDRVVGGRRRRHRPAVGRDRAGRRSSTRSARRSPPRRSRPSSAWASTTLR